MEAPRPQQYLVRKILIEFPLTSLSLIHMNALAFFFKLFSAEDLDDVGLATAKQCIADVFDDPPPLCSYSEMARRIRNSLDKKMEVRGWSVVVGRAYGAYITQKIKAYAYISVYPGSLNYP